jgi:hypothetical protein
VPKHRARRVVTLHAPLGKAIAHELLLQIRESLEAHGARDVWISQEGLPDLTIMASVPYVPTAEESSPPSSGPQEMG